MLWRRQNPESEAARKKAEADRLRAAEKFMVIGTGEATCPGCGYEYRPKNGDSEYPVPPGTLFQARRPLGAGGSAGPQPWHVTAPGGGCGRCFSKPGSCGAFLVRRMRRGAPGGGPDERAPQDALLIQSECCQC